MQQIKQALKGMPLHLEKAEGIKFGQTLLDFLCVNMPPICNYKCEKCFTWANQHDLKKFIGKKEINKIVTQAKEMGVKTVGILGEGEPLICPEIKDVIKKIDGLGMIPLIATNGYFLKPDMADFLFKHGASIALSLDTLNADEYKKYCRGSADLNVVKKNIEYARKVFAKNIFKKNGYKVYQLAIHMTVTAKNYRNLEEVQQFCGDDIYFSCEHIAKVGVANDNPEIYGGKENLQEYVKVVNKTRKIMDPMVMTKTPRHKDTCCFYYYGFAVGYEGEIMLDTHALETKGIIGNVRQKSMEELVNKSKEIKDNYYLKHGGHYCIVRDPKYREYVDFLKGYKTKSISKARC